MQKNNWHAQGVEPTPSAAEYAKKRFSLDIFQGFLEQSNYEEESFDVVTFWDVLEHSFSPRQDLKKTFQLLCTGGLVAINIPNWDSPDRKIFGPNWIGLDPPRHLYIFTRTSLDQLLIQTGFTPLAWVCFMPSYFSFIISVERWLNANSPRLSKPISKVLNFPGVRLLFQPYFSIANRIGRGGVISVFAQKNY
jgi:SAM-dependent methyltransferase